METTNVSIESQLEILVNIPLFVILVFIAVFIILSNTFTITVILRTKGLMNVTGYLMISLAAADLGVGVTSLTPLVYAIFTDKLSMVSIIYCCSILL